MTEEKLRILTKEGLISQKKGQIVLLLLLVGVAIALLYFPLVDKLNSKESDALELVIPLCCIASTFFVWGI